MKNSSLFFNESDYKPGYVFDDHLSRSGVATRFKRPTRRLTGHHMSSIRSCFEWGLHGPACYQAGGSLLHCLSTLTTCVAVYLCCTILRVASTRRYLASCPMKPGLSSPAAFRFCSRDHLSNSFRKRLQFTI